MPSTPELKFDQGTLLLSGVSQHFIERVFHEVAWVFDARVGNFRCDALHYADVLAALDRQLTSVWADNVPDWKELDLLAKLDLTAEQSAKRKTVQLRVDQMRAVETWLATRRGCLVMPTGTGKTEVALKLIMSVASSTLIVAPVRDLMYQWHRRILLRTGIDAGIMGDGVYRVSPLTVTTYDSAFLHMARLGNQFALIVFDECHHLPGPARQDAARMCAAPYRLGLTATPYRGDGRQVMLEYLIGPICYQQKLEEARGETLADYDLHRIPVYLSDAERRRYDELSRTIQHYMYQRRQEDSCFTWQKLCQESGRDPASRRALQAFHAKSAIEDRAEEKLRVLEDLFRLHVGEPCLIFTGTNAMARDISRRFLIPCLLSHCGKRERLDILSGLEEGRYPAVVA
ncbi:MAG: DEAD/DEAH box helicase family protein, partial [Aureliella sp.]